MMLFPQQSSRDAHDECHLTNILTATARDATTLTPNIHSRARVVRCGTSAQVCDKLCEVCQVDRLEERTRRLASQVYSDVD